MKPGETFLLGIALTGLLYKAGSGGVREAVAVPQAEPTWEDILHEPERFVYFDPLMQDRKTVKAALKADRPHAGARLQELADHGDVWAKRMLAAGFTVSTTP